MPNVLFVLESNAILFFRSRVIFILLFWMSCIIEFPDRNLLQGRQTSKLSFNSMMWRLMEIQLVSFLKMLNIIRKVYKMILLHFTVRSISCIKFEEVYNFSPSLKSTKISINLHHNPVSFASPVSHIYPFPT